MIQIDKLNYTDTGIHIEASITDNPQHWYQNTKFNGIYIHDQNTIQDVLKGGSIKENTLYSKTIEETTNVEIDISKDKYSTNPKFDNNDNILYVYLTTNGEVSMSCPCSNNDNVVGVLMDSNTFTNDVLSSLSDVGENCSIDNNFVNKLLQYFALEMAAEKVDIPTLNLLWTKFIQGKGVLIGNSSSCGCYG